MKLRRVRIRGFQSFTDSGNIEFNDGVNLIIGQNNGGKSALLRALQQQLTDDRHRTPGRWAQYELPLPEVHMHIEVTGDELKRGALRYGQQLHLPIRAGDDPQQFLEELWNCAAFEFELVRSPGTSITSPYYPSHRLFAPPAQHDTRTAVVHSTNGGMVAQGPYADRNDTIPTFIDYMWGNDMFFFSAERMTIGESGYNFADRLSSNANNLPAVLLTLSGNKGDLFARLVGHLREIFSTVGNLSVTPTAQNTIEVRVWPTHAMERVELSFPLNSSGTGVSQIIAILTAVMTTNNSVVIIDEINSFLHPAAVKALLRILVTEYTLHQYIISTHAPEVISFSNAKTVHLVKRDGYESMIERLDITEVGKFREVAEHLGVSMADVFASERVIWVEGPTEEISFPYIYHQLSGGPMPRGTIFSAVAATGDFNRKRDRAIVYEVYAQLSQAAAPLVVAVVFSFDTEELTDADKEKMIRDSGGRLKFLPRRHIECYLLDPSAIASMIVAKDPHSSHSVSAETVSSLLAKRAADRKFHVPEWNGDLSNDTWLAKVDAANLISQVTSEISENRATFNKKYDSLGLLQDILVRTPEQLRPLYNYVRGLVVAVSDA